MLKPIYKGYIRSIQKWVDVLYQIETGTSRVHTESASYIKYIDTVSKVYEQYEELKHQERVTQKQTKQSRKRQKTSKQELSHISKKK
jgi:hypothetical protein